MLSGMVSDAGALIREARTRHRVTQDTLARRAGTTQRQVSRIESGQISPSVSTLTRLLAALGERLELRAAPAPHDPGRDAEMRADYEQRSNADRVAESIALSRTLTGIAARR
jgi:transcriptional regulator with XRE-family HTH domain